MIQQRRLNNVFSWKYHERYAYCKELTEGRRVQRLKRCADNNYIYQNVNDVKKYIFQQIGCHDIDHTNGLSDYKN